jgi:flagellar biosynthesis/type III secretory pathway chaperone
MNKLDFTETILDRYDSLVFLEYNLKQRLEKLRLDEIVEDKEMFDEAEQIWKEIHDVIEQKFWVQQFLFSNSRSFNTDYDFEEYEAELLSEDGDDYTD